MRRLAESVLSSSVPALDDAAIWPVPAGGIRILHPQGVLQRMRESPMTRDIHPLAAGHYPAARGQTIARRGHLEPLLYYCLAGRGSIEIDGKAGALTTGDFVVFPADLPHSFSSDPQSPWTVMWIYFGGQQAQEYCRLLDAGTPQHIGVRPDLVSQMAWQVRWPEQGYSALALVLAAHRLAAMLVEFATAADGADRAINRSHIEAAIEWMKQRLEGPIALADVADVCNSSQSHFIRKFRAATGYSPISYHTVLRVQHACQLLDDTDRSIAAAGEAVGYPDPQHFSRVFRRIVGVSPRDYRQSGFHRAKR